MTTFVTVFCTACNEFKQPHNLSYRTIYRGTVIFLCRSCGAEVDRITTRAFVAWVNYLDEVRDHPPYREPDATHTHPNRSELYGNDEDSENG